jgi:hypothetical protein
MSYAREECVKDAEDELQQCGLCERVSTDRMFECPDCHEFYDADCYDAHQCVGYFIGDRWERK